MSNPNWNNDSNAGRNSKGGVKGNWSDRGTISIPEASPKEKEKAISVAKGTITGSAKGMGAATKGDCKLLQVPNRREATNSEIAQGRPTEARRVFQEPIMVFQG